MNGTTVIGEIDDPAASYSFDIFMVFKHDESGRVFYGSDSGCSCPSPFEDDHFNGPDDTSFTEVTWANLEDFARELWGHYGGSSQDEKRHIDQAVRKLLEQNSRGATWSME